jgi:Tfp pilus assembly protein PilV
MMQQQQQQQAAQQQQQLAAQQQQHHMMMQMVMNQRQQSSPIPNAHRAALTPNPDGANFTMKHAFDGTSYAKSGGISVALGDTVTLLSKNGGWAKVRTADGRVGNVPLDRLAALAGLPPPPPPPPTTGMYV